MSPVLDQVAAVPCQGGRQAEASEFASLNLIASLARSRHGGRFALRGAWCLAAWFGGMPRPTAAIDYLDLHNGEYPLGALRDAPPVGRAVILWREAVSKHLGSGWSAVTRVTVPAVVAGRQYWLAVNVARHATVPSSVEHLLLPTPSVDRIPCLVACCTRERMVAEKAALMVTYGPDHSRLQDFLDVWLLKSCFAFDGHALASALEACAAGRDAERMMARRDGYWQAAFDPRRVNRAMRSRWEKLATSTSFASNCPSLEHVIRDVGTFLAPLINVARASRAGLGRWYPSRGWIEQSSLGLGPQQMHLDFLAGRREPGTSRVAVNA